MESIFSWLVNIRKYLSRYIILFPGLNNFEFWIKGDGRVHWTETSTQIQQNQNGFETIHYQSNEEYLKLNILLIEKQQNTDFYLEIGEQSFPFSIVLPNNLPTSVFINLLD